MGEFDNTLLNHASDVVYWARKDGSFAFVNQAACTTLGYDASELLQRNVFDIHADLTPEIWRKQWQDPSDGRVRKLRRNYLSRDGCRVPVEVQSRLSTIAGERLSVSCARNLTDLLEQETVNESLISYLSALFLRSPVPKIVINPDSGAVVDANPAAALLFDCPRGALRAMNIYQSNGRAEAQVKKLLQRVAHADCEPFEFRHTDASGRKREMNVFSARVSYRNLSLLHATLLDVTKLVQSRNELSRFKTFVERVPIGVYQATAGADGIFLAANPALCSIFDVAAENDLVGRRVADLYANPAERGEFSRLVEEKGALSRDVRQVVTVTGEPIWAAITA